MDWEAREEAEGELARAKRRAEKLEADAAGASEFKTQRKDTRLSEENRWWPAGSVYKLGAEDLFAHVVLPTLVIYSTKARLNTGEKIRGTPFRSTRV